MNNRVEITIQSQQAASAEKLTTLKQLTRQ